MRTKTKLRTLFYAQTCGTTKELRNVLIGGSLKPEVEVEYVWMADGSFRVTLPPGFAGHVAVVEDLKFYDTDIGEHWGLSRNLNEFVARDCGHFTCNCPRRKNKK